MSNSKVFKKVSSLIKEVLSTEKVTKEIERLLNVKRRLGEEMERLDEERRNEPVIELKELIDVKRDRVRDQYKAIINDIKALQEQEDDSQGNKERLDKMLSFLNNKKLTPDMLTKDIIEAFIYRIIAIDEGNLVFIIDTSHKVSVEALIDQRYEIIKKRSNLSVTNNRIRSNKKRRQSITKLFLFNTKKPVVLPLVFCCLLY